jgi:RecA/RadA recombinase
MERRTTPTAAPRFTRRAPVQSLSKQVEARLTRGSTPEPKSEWEGSDSVVSTGSTLLDLAISGGRFEEGGIPGGIMVEIFGPSSAGKTVMLCELAGAVQRKGGKVMFKDPEARLNGQFASMFGFKVEDANYEQPDTVPEVFEPIRKWEPPEKPGVVHGIFADSLAALSTDAELADRDQYGMRRAKEFSEECRKTCRIITKRNLLMVCSNQVRQNIDAGPFSEKYSTPGGMAIGYYSSLRLRCHSPIKMPITKKIGKGDVKRVIGVHTTVEVYKSSVWKPFHAAPVYIVYDYGVDDVRANLQFVKDIRGLTNFQIGDRVLGNALVDGIKIVEEEKLEKELKKETIELWHDVERKFEVKRVAKRRE